VLNEAFAPRIWPVGGEYSRDIVEKEIANVFSTVILSVVHSLMLTTL
jgi:hypothetical protein